MRGRHAERHHPTGFGFAFGDRVEYLDGGAWDRVTAQGCLFFRRDVLPWRCQRLSLGRTALEPKAALGAKPEPMSVWLRHRVPALNWMLRGMLNAVPHDEAPQRIPFKAVAGGSGK